MLRRLREPQPTVRQIYALAAVLCELADERFPASFDEASELLERLRRETGHPRPRLEDTPLRYPPSRRRRRSLRGAEEAWPHGSV